MATKKSLEMILNPPAPHMVGDGFRVHNFFPGGPIRNKYRLSPFFLLDYGSKIDFGPSRHQRGVGVHPHRGFETVTIAYHGKIAHHDSAGHAGVIGEGDVQWMTAASGLLHKEYHEENYSKTGGPFQMVQLWVNLPAKYKMTPPKYQEITNTSMGKHLLADGKSIVEVIAGEYKGTRGPASTFTPILAVNARLEAGAAADFSLPASWNTAMLVIEGSVSINGQKANTDQFILFGNDGTEIELQADEKSVVLLLSGEPIDEEVVAYGPFVMNSWEEIEQAIQDVNTGKFGYLEE